MTQADEDEEGSREPLTQGSPYPHVINMIISTTPLHQHYLGWHYSIEQSLWSVAVLDRRGATPTPPRRKAARTVLEGEDDGGGDEAGGDDEDYVAEDDLDDDHEALPTSTARRKVP